MTHWNDSSKTSHRVRTTRTGNRMITTRSNWTPRNLPFRCRFRALPTPNNPFRSCKSEKLPKFANAMPWPLVSTIHLWRSNRCCGCSRTKGRSRISTCVAWNSKSISKTNKRMASSIRASPPFPATARNARPAFLPTNASANSAGTTCPPNHRQSWVGRLAKGRRALPASADVCGLNESGLPVMANRRNQAKLLHVE